eukprot:6616855-Heterocapsa_arctica.AAC.1
MSGGAVRQSAERTNRRQQAAGARAPIAELSRYRDLKDLTILPKPLSQAAGRQTYTYNPAYKVTQIVLTAKLFEGTQTLTPPPKY